MLSRTLEQTLHRALSFATERRHEYATLEHLLLGLTDDAEASAVLSGCGVDLEKLRDDLTGFLDKELTGLVIERPNDPKPTAGFQRVVQRAAIHVQSAGHDEVTGANVLVALFSESESHAVYFLHSQGMRRLDAANLIGHGLTGWPPIDEARPVDAAREGRPTQDRAADHSIPHHPGLEQVTRRALAFASERKHEYATLEHLLLALTEDPDAAMMLRACGVDMDKLRTDLTGFLDKDLAGLATDQPGDPKPTASFQRVVQRAAMHVQSAGRDEVTGANVLVALFGERESHAVFFLQTQDMTRLDAVNFISHGIAKAPGHSRDRLGQPREIDQPPRPDRAAEPAGMYKVLILNDDFTPMEFVVEVLRRVFGKSWEEAAALMLDVHRNGVGVCGVFTYGVAEAKMAHAMDLVRHGRHQLQCAIEKE